MNIDSARKLLPPLYTKIYCGILYGPRHGFRLRGVAARSLDAAETARVQWSQLVTNPDYATLLSAALDPSDPATLAFAGVMSKADSRPAPYRAPIAGFDQAGMSDLLQRHFPALDRRLLLAATPERISSPEAGADEFADLVALLDEHAGVAAEECHWVALAIATASMGANHLWQDMGLPNRGVLSRLIESYFGSLFVRNVGDMKWKKFFYRQLCERAEILLCKSPSCGECVDHGVCFGGEDASAPGHFMIVPSHDCS